MSAEATRAAHAARPVGLRSPATAGTADAPAALPEVEALGLVETETVARGAVVTDSVLKMAPVELLFAGEVSPGKFVVLFGGDVGPTRASHARGVEVAGERHVSDLLIPGLHPSVLPALEGSVTGVKDEDALGTIETTTVAATILAADRAAKTSPITLRKIRLAQGLGGNGFVYLTGSVHDVESAVHAGTRIAGSAVRDWSIVPRLHDAARGALY